MSAESRQLIGVTHARAVSLDARPSASALILLDARLPAIPCLQGLARRLTEVLGSSIFRAAHVEQEPIRNVQ